MAIPLYDKLVSAFNGAYADANRVEVDRTRLNSVQGDDTQDMANELERLYGIVRGIQDNTQPSERPLNIFDQTPNPLTITSSNLGDFINRNSVWFPSVDNVRFVFNLPTEAILGSQYPAIFEISNLSEFARRDSGFSPTNTIQIRTQGSDTLRRDTPTGALLQFSELHKGDTAVITKSAAGQPWVVVESSTDPRTSILPNGVFQFNSRSINLRQDVNGNVLLSGLSLYTPSQGDAFVVTGSGITEESNFGRVIEAGDVLVAKVDDPSVNLISSNDDWAIIRDAGHGELTLSELRFLAQISEADTFTDSRLVDRSDVTDVRVFLSPYILDHAPFISPSTDPDNPQSGETTEYIGGDELDGIGFEFKATAAQLNPFTGANSATLASRALVYVDIDGSFPTSQLDDVYLVVKDIDGNEVSRHNLDTEFRSVVLTGSSDTYYVFDDVAAADNYSSINYTAGQEIDVVVRNTNRSFVLSNAINVLNAIKTGSITIDKLESNIQALLLSNHSLSANQEAKLEGLQATSNPTVWTAGDLYVKDNDASSSNDISHYDNVGQQNGILPNYERTRNVTFLVPNFVNVTGLVKADNNAETLTVTPIGIILGRQAFTATLPAITGASSVLDNAWIVNGMASNSQLTGADNTFKVHVGNLGQDVLDRTAPSAPQDLPEALQSFSSDLTRTTRTLSGWRDIQGVSRVKLTRQFAALWDENRANVGTNYFNDIAGAEGVGFAGNTVFVYSDPNAQFNTSFPGSQVYILNDNYRVRNNPSTNDVPITPSLQKVISFDYALNRELIGTDVPNMLRIGGTSSTALLGLSANEGLFLNIGRNDGGQRSRTYDSFFQVDGHQWHDPVGQVTSTEAEVIIPNDLTGSLTVKVAIQLDNNGNDEGTHEESFTITNVDADQNLGNRNFDWHDVNGVGGTVVRTLSFNYDHDNTDLSVTRRVLHIQTTHPLTNAALTYNIRASRSITETWNVANTYVRYPVNAGSGHDDYGLFDPHLYNTEHVRERNRILLVMRKYIADDPSVDPEMAVQIIVDGQVEGESSNSNVIRLHRPMSDFDFNDINFGNSIVGVSHIQIYNYDLVPTISEMQAWYLAQNRWFGAFTDADDATDVFKLDANLEILREVGIDRGLILSSENGTRYLVKIGNNGAITTKTV